MASGNEQTSGFQQFPLVSYSIPDDDEIKERIALALNLKDGQQSIGQSEQDPYTLAVKYIEKHKIVEVFQVTIATFTHYYPLLTHGHLTKLCPQMQIMHNAFLF